MNRSLDALALFALSGVLLVAFYYQIVLSELPCPLCALQRVGFIVAGAGLILNLRVGISPAHYGLVLLTAVAAGGASLRQIALHIVPGTGHYGSALFGIHFYTWAFVGYGALVVYVGVMLLLGARASAHEPEGRMTERERVPARPGRWQRSHAGCSWRWPRRTLRRSCSNAVSDRVRTILSGISGGREPRN